MKPDTKTCPDCAEDVREHARICRFCGYDFEAINSADEEDAGQSDPPSPRRWKAIALVIMILIVLWLLILGSNSSPATQDANEEAVTINTDGQDQPQTAATQQPSAPPSATLSAAQLLRANNPHACSAPAVTGFITQEVLGGVDRIYGTERASIMRAKVRVGVSEIGETSIDSETSQMGCSANVHITAGGGTRAVLVQYTLQPSLESEDDVLIGGDWREAQNVVVNTIALGQFFGTDQGADPSIVAQ